MDANELAMIAYDVMPGGIMTETGKGEMFGVLKMALRTLEAQHAALLEEADNETAEAKKLWREALAAFENERNLFLRDEGPPGALSVALRDRDIAVAEMKAAQRAADEFKLQRSVAESELSTCRADRDMFKRLRAQCMNERDAYATKLEEVQAELQKRINALDAENSRLHRSLEERMSVRIPGAVQVAKTDELHGMAKVYLVPAGADDL